MKLILPTIFLGLFSFRCMAEDHTPLKIGYIRNEGKSERSVVLDGKNAVFTAEPGHSCTDILMACEDPRIGVFQVQKHSINEGMQQIMPGRDAVTLNPLSVVRVSKIPSKGWSVTKYPLGDLQILEIGIVSAKLPLMIFAQICKAGPATKGPEHKYAVLRWDDDTKPPTVLSVNKHNILLLFESER